ncbi:hypothetical protein CRENBAI_009003 [Crenichthys baileyi]|uniref:Uncharacterized protein n=1 Tax=Crenichthys baileyi TaxID=28760 RepID=A0AAV9SL98_9TELE
MARDYAARCPGSPGGNAWMVTAVIILTAQGKKNRTELSTSRGPAVKVYAPASPSTGSLLGFSLCLDKRGVREKRVRSNGAAAHYSPVLILQSNRTMGSRLAPALRAALR